MGGCIGWWICFRISAQYFAGLLVVAVLCGFGRRWKSAAAFFLFAGINFAIVWPWLRVDQTLAQTDGIPVRAMLINVNTHSGDPELVRAELEHWSPTVVVLEEISESWVEDLAPVLAAYPHNIVRPRSDNFGIGIYSQLPLRNTQSKLLSNASVPTLFAEVEWQGGDFQLIATHPVPPVGAEYSANRNQQLEALAETVNPAMPTLLVGDLNTTPWNTYFQQLLRDADLIDSSKHRGLQTTWPTSIWPMRIPLDHVLHTTEIRVLNRWVGSDIGSDHLPVVLDFDLRPNSTE